MTSEGFRKRRVVGHSVVRTRNLKLFKHSNKGFLQDFQHPKLKKYLKQAKTLKTKD